ncbi:MAG: LytTR family DNA-binding domain-containing protein [Clostridia bacterium]
MFRFILCDDNPLHNQTLSHHLAQLQPRLKADIEIALVATDARDVMAYAKCGAPDIHVYLLDLVLEQSLSGVDLCKTIHESDPTAYVIFISAYPEFALDCCQAHAFDFVQKPYTLERLESCLNAVFRETLLRAPMTPLTIHAGSRLMQIDQRDILYIAAQREYVTAHMLTGLVTWRESLTKLSERLQPGWFERIHKSYVVNWLHAKQMEAKACEITLIDGQVLPVSRHYLPALKAHIANSQ